MNLRELKERIKTAEEMRAIEEDDLVGVLIHTKDGVVTKFISTIAAPALKRNIFPEDFDSIPMQITFFRNA